MSGHEIREDLKKQPFEPLRLVISDGSHYDIFHPDLCFVGASSTIIGFSSMEGSPLFERTVRVDNDHISRILPIRLAMSHQPNGK